MIGVAGASPFSLLVATMVIPSWHASAGQRSQDDGVVPPQVLSDAGQ
jgi:hypothetical protein